MKPYTGKVLWVDLSHGTWTEQTIPDDIYRKFLGGSGLGAWLLYQAIPAGADPLGPENVLGFLPGLLTGTGSLFTGRWMAVGKSPLTGGWGEANCGGTLALAIKQCGYDGIFFKGVSANPVYLLIDHHGPHLLEAEHLWGKDAVETERWLLGAHRGKKLPAAAVIGPSAENLSLISGIVNDGGRLAARSGLGAVMGSKRLKAVVLAGARRVGAHDPLKTRLLSIQCSREIQFSARFLSSNLLSAAGNLLSKLPVNFTQPGIFLAGILSKWGTIGSFPYSAGTGDTPYKNWLGTAADMTQGNGSIDPDRMLRIQKRKYHCRGCPLGCGAIIGMNNQPAQESHQPEYETTASFSSLLLIDDLELVCELNELCNRAGMDSISAGSALAFAMECYEKGWISQQDTGGIELTWGNGDAIRQVLIQMIQRQGFGAWLTDGVKRAAEKLPSAAQAAAIHAGGQEIAYHDPRLDPGLALHASVDPTPGRHTTGGQQYYELYALWKRVPDLPSSPLVYGKRGRFDPGNGRTESAVATSNFTQFYTSMGACYFGMLVGVDRVPIFEWANAATGWDFSPAEYLRTGQRIQTVRQMFNLQHGLDPKAIRISPRLTGQPPMNSGPHKDISYDLEPLIVAYWQAIGWGEGGIPTPETLAALDLTALMPAPQPEDLP
ncbi:MAG: aldehyde ferredoxin oxidoreductase family protein [Anaerolineales bacterium]|nr:aldehyde ferredoxin oxidoreductase family protein [Anaerolineales bacterium]